MKKWENKVTALLHPMDWKEIEPCIAVCENDEELHVFNYLRIATSYMHQKMTDIKRSRATRMFAIDYRTGGILGIILHGDIYDQWKLRDDFLGWSPHWRSRNINKILHIQKALPLLGFGDFLVGKLLILLSISTETIKYVSYKYSQPICVVTMSGMGLKRLPYCERLPGVEFVGYHEKGEKSCSLYSFETMRGGYRHLRGEAPDSRLRYKTATINENSEYWRERWLKPRLKRKPKNDFDPGFYKLDSLLEAAN